MADNRKEQERAELPTVKFRNRHIKKNHRNQNYRPIWGSLAAVSLVFTA